MANEPSLIVQVPRGSAVQRQLSEQPPASVAGGDVVVETGATDAEGNLEAISAGEVVMSVPSPEALSREADEVRRVIAQSGTGVEPLVVVVEAAEELRDEELAPALAAAAHTVASGDPARHSRRLTRGGGAVPGGRAVAAQAGSSELYGSPSPRMSR